METPHRGKAPLVKESKARGCIARGGGGATPLALPESIRILEMYLHFHGPMI